MRKVLFVCIALLSVSSVFGQQDPLHANYRFNSFIVNPAAAGMEGQWAARASYRSEWTRFPGAPITTTASISGLISDRSAVGLNFISDVIGPENTWGFQGAYAYHIPLNTSNLSLGLGFRGVNYSLDPARTITLVPNDPAVMFDPEWLMDLSFGAFLYNRKYYIGVSAPQVVQISDPEVKELVPHIYGLLGYKFLIGGSTILEPSAFLKFASEFQFDINLKAWFLDNQLMFGAGYRDAGFISVMTGFNVKDRYQFSYAYDFSTQDFQAYTWGSHEVTFGIEFGKQRFNHLDEHKMESKTKQEDMEEEEGGDEEMEMDEE